MKFLPKSLTLACCFSLLASVTLLAQSKKELRAEVARLNEEVTTLKAPKEVDLSDRHEQAGYALGVIMGSTLQAEGLDSLDLEAVMLAFEEMVSGTETKIERAEADQIIQAYLQEAQNNKNKAALQAGADFLSRNKEKEGVTVTESGLQYKVLKEGTGKTPGAKDKVTVHYQGMLSDGTVFDSSIKRGEPIKLKVNQVIAGWTEALQLMQEGDHWELYVPYPLGYGERGAGEHIPPYATLIFEVQLISVDSAQ